MTGLPQKKILKKNIQLTWAGGRGGGRPSTSMPRPATNRRSRALLSIPRASFSRLVHELTDDYRSEMRWSAEALEALQGDAEEYLQERFQGARSVSALCGRQTLTKKHFLTPQPVRAA